MGTFNHRLIGPVVAEGKESLVSASDLAQTKPMERKSQEFLHKHVIQRLKGYARLLILSCDIQ